MQKDGNKVSCKVFVELDVCCAVYVTAVFAKWLLYKVETATKQ